MKTLCFSLGLLLLTVSCCNAVRKLQEYKSGPEDCCFSFMTRPLPLKRVSGISLAHSSCPRPALVVKTITGTLICYSPTFQWAQNVYLLQSMESMENSGQQ